MIFGIKNFGNMAFQLKVATNTYYGEYTQRSFLKRGNVEFYRIGDVTWN